MNAVLKRSSRKTLPDTPRFTCLPESAAGASRSGLPVGLTTGRSGQAVAPVSLTAVPVKKRAKKTTETCGRPCTGSSASAALSEYLANRLKAQLGTAGSMIYKQTWKRKTTPSGIVYWAHTARAHRISDSDCIGWPTPNVLPASNNVNLQCSGDGRTTPNKLGWAAALAGWPTATVSDATAGARPPDKKRGSAPGLIAAAQLAGFPTPRVSDTNGSKPPPGKQGGLGLNQLVGFGTTQTGSTAETTSTGQLNQDLSRWLMGYPYHFETCLPSYSDWQAWQGLMAQACAGQNPTG